MTAPPVVSGHRRRRRLCPYTYIVYNMCVYIGEDWPYFAVATVRCNWLVLRVALRLNPYARGASGDPFFLLYFRFPSLSLQHHTRAYIAVGLFRRSSAERVRSSPARASSSCSTPHSPSPTRPGLPEIGYTHTHTHTHTLTLVAETLLLLDIRSAAAACISLKTTTLIAHPKPRDAPGRKKTHRPSAIKTVDRTRIIVATTIHCIRSIHIYIHTHTHKVQRLAALFTICVYIYMYQVGVCIIRPPPKTDKRNLRDRFPPTRTRSKATRAK